METTAAVLPSFATGSKVKVLRSRAQLGLRASTLDARADRLASHGMSLMVARSTREHEPCVVQMDVLVNGDRRRVNAIGTVVSCSCAGMEGFRLAIRFTQMDDESAAAIALLLTDASAPTTH